MDVSGVAGWNFVVGVAVLALAAVVVAATVWVRRQLRKHGPPSDGG